MNFLKKFFGHPAVTLPVSASLLVLAGALVLVHAVTIRQVKEVGLPAAIELPQMEKRLSLLQEQLEAAELQEALQNGSAPEQLKMYILPQKLDLGRLLATFDILRDAFQRDRLLFSMSAIQVGEEISVPGNERVRAIPFSFQAEVTQEGMDKLMLLIRLSGNLTVSDTLSPQQLSQLINLTEEENPAALTVLEQFLATDLLLYVREPAIYEHQVLRSLTSETFEQSFANVLQSSGLAKARYLYGGMLGQLLETHNLWPTQKLGLEHVEVTPLGAGRYRVALRLQAYLK
jgi:hypothetical protein